MKLHYGNMWDVPADLYFVTSNSYIKKDGSLTMGVGAALEAAQKYSTLPMIAGTTIAHLTEYHVRFFKEFPIGLFQVKKHWRDDADFDLISNSTRMLIYFARSYNGTIVLNFLGIGAGNLDRSDVLVILKSLPDNVIVCER